MEKPEVAKASHKEADYESESKEHAETCSRCQHFIDTDPARCETVASPIEAQGWCVKFVVDPSKLTHAEYRKFREEGGGKRLDQESIDMENYRRRRESAE